jgi:ABC-type ATPase involved in cell division
VFATHDIDLVQRYPYRTIYLSGGKRVDLHKDEEVETGE